MAVSWTCFYWLPILAMVCYNAICQHSSYSIQTHDGGAFDSKSFREEQDTRVVHENNTEDEDWKLDSVLGLLEKLQTQVDELQTNIETMCSAENFKQERPLVLKIMEKSKCPQNAAPLTAPKYEVNNCGKGTGNAGNFFLVDGTSSPHIQSEAFCSVIAMKTLSTKQYSVKAQIYNINALYGSYYGFPGIAFNVINEKNFDFVIIRIHDRNGCYRTGYVQNGRLNFVGSKSGLCPAGNPPGRTWFSVEVQVFDTKAMLLVKDVQTAIFHPHFPSIGRGGVIVKLGEENVIRFRALTIQPTYKRLFDIINCQASYRISENYYRLDSRSGRWPDNEFCKAIYKKEISGTDYSISVKLFNQRGTYGTHLTGKLGIMFNAENENNYDFIYFNPESKYGCYYTGFVQNSIVKWINSKVGSCAGGTFKGGRWNHVALIIRDDKMMVYLEGRHILSSETYFQSRPRAGVISANNYEGSIISFMDFKLEHISPSVFTTRGCNKETRMVNDYYILDAKHGKWPNDTFCRAFTNKLLHSSNYMISAEMFMSEKWSSDKVKEYFGLGFNVKDDRNYDFVFVRPKNTFCYYVGYVRDGKIRYTSQLDGECKGGPPNKGTWFKMTLFLRDSIVMVNLDGNHLVTAKPHFPSRSRGGIIVANGYKNMVTIRNFQASVIDPLPMELSKCGPKTNIDNDTIILDAVHPYWPLHLFCAALYKKSLPTTKQAYTAEAMLFNVESYSGSYWGQPGIMYNALNSYTYEYVYIRIHNKVNCYQFGSVRGGQIIERRSHSGSCQAMRPQQNEWFKLTVKVSNDGDVHLNIDNVPIAKYRSSLQFMPRGGVLAPNGFKNIIMARNFTIF